MSNTGTIKRVLNIAAWGTTYAAENAAPSLLGKALIAVGLQNAPFIIVAAPYILACITVAKAGITVFENVNK